jgi:hypothetical protein
MKQTYIKYVYLSGQNIIYFFIILKHPDVWILYCMNVQIYVYVSKYFKFISAIRTHYKEKVGTTWKFSKFNIFTIQETFTLQEFYLFLAAQAKKSWNTVHVGKAYKIWISAILLLRASILQIHFWSLSTKICPKNFWIWEGSY